MSHLFTPLALGPLTLPNRIVVAPMCQYSATDGCASDWHLIHLGHLALSGAGALIIEATAVEARGRITWADLGLYSDANEAALSRVVQSVRRYAPITLGIQLAHAGRKASTTRPWEGGNALPATDPHGWQTVGASPVSFRAGDPAPRAMSTHDIERTRQAFVDTALRAHRLGMDFIELHAAHGYLLHQFLSPLANRREDDYGGSLQNRMRLTLEVFRAVRAALPDTVPVGIRLSASDWVDGGWDLAQSIELARALDGDGCSYIHVSSGGLDPAQKIGVSPGYQVPFAEVIRARVSMPVIAVGLITEPGQAEAIIAEGRADAVALARGMLYDPRWPWHAAAKLGAHVHAPSQYLRSEPHAAKGLFLTR